MISFTFSYFVTSKYLSKDLVFEWFIFMAHPSSDNRLCSPGMFRLVLFLVSLCLVGFTLKQQMLMHSTARASSSCSLCECDCSTLPTSSDCAKEYPEMNEEMKDIVTLLTEEIILLKNVNGDSLAHTKTMIMDAKKTSSHYQKEAEKCKTGMETCEEAREKAIAALSEERKLSELWETRARENGWQD